MTLNRFGAALVLALALVTAAPAATTSAGGGTVAGPCGTLSSVTASNVTLKVGAGGWVGSPLSFKGGLSNCSVYVQRYWIDFSEPARPAAGGFNQPVVTCTTNYRLLLNTYVSSGSSLGWSGSTSITPTPVTDPSSCVGTHTVRVDLKSRTDGRVLHTVFVTYTVTKA